MDEEKIIICENCYEQNESTRTTCKNCGHLLYNNTQEKNETSSSTAKKRIREKEILKNQYEYNKSSNKVATIIKTIAIILAIICTIMGLLAIDELKSLSIVIILTGVISAIFVYALGEIIQLLEDIKNK